MYYDAVGDIAGARLGPYPSLPAAEADVAARKAAGKQVPSPVQYKWLVDGWYALNPVWGCSLTQWQIRALDDPTSGNAADRWRVAEKLHGDPLYATKAARVISKNWTDFTPWSAFKSEKYKDYLNHDYKLVPGHPSAEKWNL